jgi:hypothetical protein
MFRPDGWPLQLVLYGTMARTWGPRSRGPKVVPAGSFTRAVIADELVGEGKSCRGS